MQLFCNLDVLQTTTGLRAEHGGHRLPIAPADDGQAFFTQRHLLCRPLFEGRFLRGIYAPKPDLHPFRPLLAVSRLRSLELAVTEDQHDDLDWRAVFCLELVSGTSGEGQHPTNV